MEHLFRYNIVACFRTVRVKANLVLFFLQERHRKSNTAPVFSVQACSVTIQSRPLARYVHTHIVNLTVVPINSQPKHPLLFATRSLTAPPKKIAPPEEPFPYPDPVRVGGDHAFNIRLTEMAGLRRETAKLEECRARVARRNVAANTASASTATTSTASSLQSNQSATRPSTAGVSSTPQSVRPSSGVSRVSSRTGLSRRTSLPAGHATTVQDKPPSPPLSGSATDHPIVRRTSSPLFSISECKSATNSGELTKPSSTIGNPINAASGNNSTGQNMDTSSSESDTAEKKAEATEGGGSNVDEGSGTAVEITAVLEKEEVIPSSHHRDLVEAIFSRAETQKQNPTTAPTPGGTTEMNNDSTHSTSQTETSGTGSPSTTKVARESKPSSTRPKSSKTNNSTQKQLQKETLPPSTPVSPTSSGVSPPSSPSSSSSITSDQSPRPASSNSGKKAHSKSSKTRKSHKKSHRKHNKNT